MNIKKAICTPIYKRRPKLYEFKNLKITDASNPKISKIFIAPNNLNTSFYEKNFNKFRIVRFANHYFKNADSYSQLLLSEFFYRKFINFSHIIICQLDAVIVKDLSKLRIADYDYIGSPSRYNLPEFSTFYDSKSFSNKITIFNQFVKEIKKISKNQINVFCLKINLYKFYSVLKLIYNNLTLNKEINYNAIGLNGGLSIRKLSSFIKVLKNLNYKKKIKAPEDHVYSYYANIKKLNIPTFFQLEKIFSEKKIYNIYGYHKLNYYDLQFMNKIHKNKFYLCLPRSSN
jgi:hypothetical protein